MTEAEAPQLELEFGSMASAQSARVMLEAAHRGDIGALDAEVGTSGRLHADEASWQQAREAAVSLLSQVQQQQEGGEPKNRFDLAGLADAATLPLPPADAAADGPAAPLPPAAAAAQPAGQAVPAPLSIPAGTVAVGVSLEDQVALATEYLAAGRQHSAEERWEEAIAAFGAGRWQLKAYFLEPEPEPEPEEGQGSAGGSGAAVALDDAELDRRAAATEHLWVSLHVGLAAVYTRSGSVEGAVYATEECLCCEPRHLEALFLRGSARMEQGDWAAASTDLGAAHSLVTALESGGSEGQGVQGAERWGTREKRQQLAMALANKRRACDAKLAEHSSEAAQAATTTAL